MTKLQAIDKISKLLRVAHSQTGNQNERLSALEQVEKLKKKYEISDSELTYSSKAEAFDKLVGILQQYVIAHRDLAGAEVVKIVNDVLNSAKKVEPAGKAAYLEKITGGVRIAVFLFGSDNKTIADLKTMIDDVLKTHNITI